MLKTLQDWDFLDNACNSGGLANALTNELANTLKGLPTDEKNCHPIVKAYLLKLCSLAGINLEMTEYSKHYEEIRNFLETNERAKS